MDITNWKITKSKTVHKNPIFSVVQQDMIRPDCSKSKYYVLERQTPYFSIVIPITEDNKTYLVGQYRVPIKKFSWEFPMGSVRGVNSPLKTAKQELKEETGITAKSWNKIGWFFVANGHTAQRGYVYTAIDLIKGTARPESGEFLKIKIVSIKEIALMIKKGEIRDGPTITAYQFYTLSV